MEEYISKVKLKQMEISSCKKRLAEAEAKHRQQQNLFELLRAERNACSKSLTEAHDEIEELRNKLKVLSNQIEQLKEDIVTKEGQLVKEQFSKPKQFPAALLIIASRAREYLTRSQFDN
ncbi:hypothetical protein K0M31_014596 [Melipona bicolor]|uniref:Cilia- and flagella-associated protein 58 central coiled coil domain-containing protein n=1 Tax=Melipona bicolor TaxID=60889 RepID=A0AA40FH32_9HYME|nr:hypothetical protein K0M31_014596 [Melipona bicolor]